MLCLNNLISENVSDLVNSRRHCINLAAAVLSVYRPALLTPFFIRRKRQPEMRYKTRNFLAGQNVCMNSPVADCYRPAQFKDGPSMYAKKVILLTKMTQFDSKSSILVPKIAHFSTETVHFYTKRPI